MRQKFYDSTIQSRFIKDLLYTTPIPNYNTVNKGDLIYKNLTYIYKTSIIKCIQTGYLLDDSFGDEAKFRKIGDYEFGMHYPKFTEQFISKNSYYDSETHKWLGKLLRCYRDIWDINLLPFYNCFNNEYVSGLKITPEGVISLPSSNAKLLKVPIKFNKTYTIAIDCNSEVMIAPIIMSRGAMADVLYNNQDYNLTDLISGTRDNNDVFVNSYNNVRRYNSMSFRNPETYIVSNTDDTIMAGFNYYDIDNNIYNPTKSEFLSGYEKELYMLIQLPIDNKSSVVILEGDYTLGKCKKIFDASSIDNLSPNIINDSLLSELSLLSLSDGEIYPYSERLIEFLLWNVICNKDEIGDNILRVQKSYNWLISYKYSIPGVWDDSLRIKIFNDIQANEMYNHLDSTGFVDKDVEDYITREL